jgi:hypothetical protein
MTIPVYLEVGSKRTLAGALDWPGWSRSGKDATSALEAMLSYGLRYAAAMRLAKVPFQAPLGVSSFQVVQELAGDTTTDFVAPGCIPSVDLAPVSDAELQRLQTILKGCWHAFDEAIKEAEGKKLKVGPRGGGRDRQKIIEHVLGANLAYLSRLVIKAHLTEGAPLERQRMECREAILKGMIAAAHGNLPSRGPRGSMHWPLRYFVRRTAWHVLDHAWETEDRTDFD